VGTLCEMPFFSTKNRFEDLNKGSEVGKIKGELENMGRDL
jgi:hypothetical protein